MIIDLIPFINKKNGLNLNSALLKNYGLILTGNGIIAICGFFQYIILARFFSSSEVGIYSLFYSAITIFYIVFTLGLPNSIIIEIPFFKEKKPLIIPQLISSTYVFVSILSVVGFIVIFLVQDYIYLFLNIDHSQLPVISFIILPFFALIYLNDFLFLGLKQIEYRTWVSISVSVLKLVLMSLLIICGYGFEGVIFGTCAAIFFGSIIGLFFHFNKNFNRVFSDINDIHLVPKKHTFLLGVNLLILLICNFLISTSNQYIISHELGPSDVGIFALCLQLISTILFIITPVLLISIPYVSEKWAVFDIQGILNIKNKLTIFSMISLFPCILFTFFGKQILILLFGNVYTEGYIPLLIIAYSTTFYLIFLVITNILSCVGKISFVSKIIIFSSFVSILLNVILIRFFQLEGAAIATFITYLVMMLLAEYGWRKWISESVVYTKCCKK